MTGIEKAKSTLVHYFKTVYSSAGLKWDGDNVTEVEGIVDDLVDGIKADVRKEIESHVDSLHGEG
jgi:hypothetical protein